MPDHGEHTAYESILEHFRAGGSLSPLEALHLFGCMRLAAVVHRMRKRDNVHIVSIEETGEDGRRWARYCLGNAADLDPATVPAGLPGFDLRPCPILQEIPFVGVDPAREGSEVTEEQVYIGQDVAALVLKALPGVREPSDILRSIKFQEVGQNQLPGVSRGVNRP